MSIKRIRICYNGEIKLRGFKLRGPLETTINDQELWQLLNSINCPKLIYALNKNGDKVKITKDNYKKTTEELFGDIKVPEVKAPVIVDNIDDTNLVTRNDINDNTDTVEDNIDTVTEDTVAEDNIDAVTEDTVAEDNIDAVTEDIVAETENVGTSEQSEIVADDEDSHTVEFNDIEIDLDDSDITSVDTSEIVHSDIPVNNMELNKVNESNKFTNNHYNKYNKYNNKKNNYKK